MQPESNLSQPTLGIKSGIDKLPKEILPGIFAFAPNRDTLGGTAYLVLTPIGNILIDAPAWHDLHRQFIADRGGVNWLAITHRGGIGQTTAIVTELGCEAIAQEQEAYLLPELKVTTFQHKFNIKDSIHAIWTPGHSPGSACFYYAGVGGVLFTGRHLLPDRFGAPVPLRTAKTFHWPRQLRSVDKIWQQFPSQQPLSYICPGANTGLLRGKGSIAVNV
ncbi:MBL fold metallo-hydrolase [Chamaesiphon polymorphus]|uniref:MBL fold metallo-hydrolase n=1 Tax=Chamaesiphon polymorphus CCALA 037 TaxID=2107692 RepID=A0A2T1G852_9CYAN|nr:MBL fold metallo-hydrolase [Chamaesiphon polymorphus]PSB53373.1 MBL fold metallo-hydrolase [Chamaesiphon polymorphus CCALA 037]